MDNIEQLIKDELARSVKRYAVVQVAVQIAIQAVAYGSMAFFVWQIQGQIQDLLEMFRELPGQAIDQILPDSLRR